MVCRLAARYGGTPAQWADHEPIWLNTMTQLANEQDQQRRG